MLSTDFQAAHPLTFFHVGFDLIVYKLLKLLLRCFRILKLVDPLLWVVRPCPLASTMVMSVLNASGVVN